MEKSDSWLENAKGNRIGSKLFIWVITKIGLFPAYFVLFFAAMQYTILDRRAKGVLREFRNTLGLDCSLFDYFKHFYSFGLCLIDRYAFLITRKTFFTFHTHNEDMIEGEIKKGKGVILLGAHFGNWELAGNLLQNRLKVKVNFLMFDAESEAVKNALKKATENRDVNIIYVGNNSADTSIALITALQRGEIVCLHGDRILDNQRYEVVSFFNRDARFPAGPFILSAATGAPVIPIFAIKTGILHYSFSALEPIRLENVSRNEREKKIRTAINHYASSLETMVRRYPYQWFNYYHFWK